MTRLVALTTVQHYRADSLTVIHIDHIWRCGRGRGRQEDVETLSAGTVIFVPIATLGPMNRE